MILVHKIEINANNKQASYFSKACGTARFSYNWALSEWKRQYSSGEKPTESKLRRELNAIKVVKYPWMLEVSKVAPQQAIKNLGTAFTRFFNKQGKYPRYKKRGIHDSFRADNGPATVGADCVKLKGKKIQIPRLGWIKLREKLRYSGQIKSVTISRKANRWYAAIAVDTDNLPHVRKNHGTIGVDLGVKALATLSNGEQIVGPKAHSALLSRLKRLSRNLSSKKRNSRNHAKAALRLSKLHARISNIRIDSLHKLTTNLVLNYSHIGIENLNVKGMLANRKLSRHIMDQSFYELRRQLEYKANWYGSKITIADRFFPSSKICSSCGAKNEQLSLSDREWQCVCGALHDRDINAAINIERLAVGTASSAGSETITV